jgi:hypothetical protein
MKEPVAIICRWGYKMGGKVELRPLGEKERGEEPDGTTDEDLHTTPETRLARLRKLSMLRHDSGGSS